jgi:hypothetical protein
VLPTPVHITATFHSATNTLTFSAPEPDDAGSVGDAGADAADGGSGSANPLEAVTLSAPNPCVDAGGGVQFACDVTMTWGSPNRSLANPLVQIASASPASNGGNPDGSNPLGLGQGLGLWVYTNSGEPDQADPVKGGGPFFLTAAGTNFNSGTRNWILVTGGCTDVTYDLLVYGSTSFTTLGWDYPPSSLAYVDVCAAGTKMTSSQATGISMPFDFTLFGQTYDGGASSPATTVNFAVNGQVTLGSTPLTTSGNSVALPSASAPAPSIWPFWDNLAFGTGGQMCYATVGSAPNRRFAIEWRNMTFANPPDMGASLDFEVLLYEGTSQIATVYHSMVAASGDASRRESGSLAFVGMQNETATVAVGALGQEKFGTGAMYLYVPE